MAALTSAFDANAVEPNTPRDTLPPGDYLAQIVRSDMKETKNGSGQYLELELAILEGVHTERRLFDRLNLVNSNQQAADIANRTLSSICRATGVMMLTDSEQLHFKAMQVKVAVRPSGPDRNGVMREAQNEIRGYTAPNGAPRTAPAAYQTAAPAARPAAAPPPAATRTAPWRTAGA